MKILQIIPSLVTGGAEIMMETLTIELKKLGNDVSVLVFYDNDTDIKRRLIENGVEIISISKDTGFSVKTLLKMRKIIKKLKPDIIHTHLHVLPYVWLSSRKVKIVHTVHSIASKEQSGFGKTICGHLYKKSRKCIPVSISSLVKESLISEYDIHKELYVVDNGINLSGRKQITSYDFSDNIDIVHVGRLTALKNHRLMIDVIKDISETIPNIKMHFYGAGEEKDALIEYTKNCNATENIIFEGLSDNVSEELCKADIFLLPSAYEGLPMSLVEAMAAGLPVIASNVGGIPDVVTDGLNGCIIEPDFESLKVALINLISNKTERERLGRNALERAFDFSSEKMAKEYLSLYDKYRV